MKPALKSKSAPKENTDETNLYLTLLENYNNQDSAGFIRTLEESN